MSSEWMIEDGIGSVTGPHTTREVLCLILDNKVNESTTFRDHEDNERYSFQMWCKTFGRVSQEWGLSYREREMTHLHFGLGGGYRYSLEEISQIFRVTPRKVVEVLDEALRKMKGLPEQQSQAMKHFPQVTIVKPTAVSPKPSLKPADSTSEVVTRKAARPNPKPPVNNGSRANTEYFFALALVLLWVAGVVSCMARPHRPGPTTPIDDYDGFDSTPLRYR